MSTFKPIILCILDGWGIAPHSSHNAITGADPKFYNYLLSNYPSTTLRTSGNCVGLPHGQMGNSEVGHMTIGSGRIIEQDLVRIKKSMVSGAYFKKLKDMDITGCCHLIGLISDGGVHSHIEHLLHTAKFLALSDTRVKLHLITDGRDTSPKSALTFVKQILEVIKHHDNISIASLSGRYYAMDRDARLERTAKAFDAIYGRKNKVFDNTISAINASYETGVYDEFIEPQTARGYEGIMPGDTVICTNFRADRMRQLATKLFLEIPIKIRKIIMTPYSDKIDKSCEVLFEQIKTENTLAQILSQNNMHQLRVAETEKYAHVTFFFNAGDETQYQLEERILVNSPKVTTYDLCPGMSANEMTDILEQEILSNKYQFILVNYANADMVGHTGNYQATVIAIQILDQCLQRLFTAVNKTGGSLIVTADHGNAESMFNDDTQLSHTAHTTNPVPLIIAGPSFLDKKISLENGTLTDIAPTILSMFRIDAPKEMSGKSLLKFEKQLTR